MSDSIEQLGSDIEEYCDSVEGVNAIAAFCERQAAITLAECESDEEQAFCEKEHR